MAGLLKLDQGSRSFAFTHLLFAVSRVSITPYGSLDICMSFAWHLCLLVCACHSESACGVGAFFLGGCDLSLHDFDFSVTCIFC